MTTLILLLAFFLPPPHQPTVTAVPPVVVTTMKPATALYIDQTGTIWACADQSYGLYVQPVESKGSIAFYYVAPPGQIQATDKKKFIATCLQVKP